MGGCKAPNPYNDNCRHACYRYFNVFAKNQGPYVFDRRKGKEIALSKLSPKTLREIEKATKMYKDFHWGFGPDKEIKCTIDIPEVIFGLGWLRGITYQTRKKGDKKDMFYIHAFNRPFPILGSSNDGTQLFICGGGYETREEGIVD